MKRPDAQPRRLTLALLTLASLLISATPRFRAAPTAPVKMRPAAASAPASDAARVRAADAYGKLPLSFEPNRGQADPRVKFLSRGAGYVLLLTSDEAIMRLNKSDESGATESAGKPKQALLRMKLIGANPAAQVAGEHQLRGRTNYLLGSDRRKWHTDIPTFSGVRYSEIYAGIDLIYYGTSQRQLEYDFILRPGARPESIRISFKGADRISIDERGDLVLETKVGRVVQRAPVVYQETEGGRQPVAGRYVLKAGREVGFEVGAYDRGKPLTIDPQVIYSTSYGGNLEDIINGMAVDRSANLYLTGRTSSTTGLILKNPFDGTVGGVTDAFVLKLNPAGTAVVYATYIGGSGSDSAEDIAITSDGKACITGSTSIGNTPLNDYPVTANRFQPGGDLKHNLDAVVTVLAANGTSLVYSTLFGGTENATSIGTDLGRSIAVDANNRLYVVGTTSSENLPVRRAFQASKKGFNDVFFAVFNPAVSTASSTLFVSTYLGGSAIDRAEDVAVDADGVAYIAGSTFSTDFPVPSTAPTFQAANKGSSDVFIAKIRPAALLFSQVISDTTLTYTTLLGGVNFDEASAVAVDSGRNIYVAGRTDSGPTNNFPLTQGAPDAVGVLAEGFVTKLNSTGTALVYSTLLGGDNNDDVTDLAIDSAGNAYVTGATDSPNFPKVNALPITNNGFGNMPFVTKLSATDAPTVPPKLLYSSLLGAEAAQPAGRAITLDFRGNVYVGGISNAAGFPTTPGAIQPDFGGGFNDGFIVKLTSTFPDTIGGYRPSTGQFFLRNSNSAGPPDLTISDFATPPQAGDQPLAGDWNGDGLDDVGLFRNGKFILRNRGTSTTSVCPFCPPGIIVVTTVTVNFGAAGDRAVVGDWNGDGIDTPGVFRPSAGQWLLTNSPNGNNSTPLTDISTLFGLSEDRPVAGDWDDDGVDSIGVYRPSVLKVFLSNSNTNAAADFSFSFGLAEDLPVAGDWNGDGVETVGLFRPSTKTFTLNNARSAPNAQTAFSFAFGETGDLPVAGDWDGRPGPATPPNSGVNNPAQGSSRAGQQQQFTTTCSDPDGWRNISTIDFKIARSDGQGDGVPLALWVQFDQNLNVIRFYNPDSQTWQEGAPGSDVVLSSRFADLHLAGTSVQGSGPTGPSVQVTWRVVFREGAVMNNYKQYLKITDDEGLTTGFDKVGSWSVRR